MYQSLLADANFHALLQAIDADIAAKCRACGCPVCQSVLHSARYPRKPRGRPRTVGEEGDWRESFCCSKEGCRKRATPASVRYLGPKVYESTVVLVVSSLQHTSATASRQLATNLGVSRRTVGRWRSWWLSTFADSRFWQAARSAFMPPADPLRLPASILERFAGELRDKVLAVLRLLQPMTGGASM